MSRKPDATFIWSIASLLRGPYKPKEYGDVVLPMTILRRADCVLAPSKEAVHQEWERSRDRTSHDLLDVRLRKKAGFSFYNTSQYTLPSLTGDSANVKANLLSYLDGFSDNVRDVFTRFGSRSRSSASTRPTPSTWWSRSSPPPTSTPSGSPTPRWAGSSRS